MNIPTAEQVLKDLADEPEMMAVFHAAITKKMARDNAPGNTKKPWNFPVPHLRMRLAEEVNEWGDVTTTSYISDAEFEELLDVINLASFISIKNLQEGD